ncbi:M50 family metallopeptidase [Klenkia taihuensis]|uniref:Peptidase M50B-like n=1 Tax=Klenkia taihuensis TaxID=1225127 RepID=A0A1I1R3I8_9ACTN|nr:M50 family metallopeptidase [Klenkia taihuensis]GHE07281.1 membrane protein [Klenkia taihuensis]SFD28865.1 Peptidase M50B-like [Klenkia taihuensis]
MSEIWDRVGATSPPLPLPWLVGTALVALVLVGQRDLWRVTRNAVTIAHEGAHGVAALITGRRLAGIRLHSDTSGVTVSAGRPTGPGMVATAFAGYPGPALLGLGAAALLAAGHAVGVLWALLLLLALLLLQIRNFYGLWSVLVTGALVFAATWWLSPLWQAAFAHVVVWFLLLAAPRAVWELQAQRRRRPTPDSDADQLARLTGVPGLVWVGVFLALCLGSLALAVRLLA